MPAYFAYGSNMHAEGFRARCPRSCFVATAVLPDHRFVLMATSGYASVRPDKGSSVHGVLVDLDAADLAALDAYEDVDGGLYSRDERALRLADGGIRSALVYLGGEAEEGGTPPPGYMECIVAAARAAALPPSYVAGLAALLPPAVAGARAAAQW